MDNDGEWLLEVLTGKLKDKEIIKLLNINYEKNLVPEGDNYLSEISAAKISVLLKNGDKTDLYFIIKRIILDEDNTLSSEDPFKKEIFVYNTVLATYERIMNESNDKSNRLWGNLVGYKCNNLMVLEDLRAQNYMIANRKVLLDKNHISLVMHSLGRIHALGHVVIRDGLVKEEHLGSHYLVNGEPETRNIVLGGLHQLAGVMKDHWEGSEWKEIAQRIYKQEDIIMEKLESLFKHLKGNFLTICHGDCWTCNIMFKYCDYPENFPCSLRFLDWQNSHINSYMFDVIEFLSISVHPKLRRKEFDHFLQIYHHSLESTLYTYGMEDKVPTLENAYKEAERLEYYSLLFSLIYLPLNWSNVSKAFLQENLNYDYKIKNAFNPEIFKSKQYIECIKDEIKRWIVKGLL